MGGRKSPFPITLAIGLYNSLYYRTSRDLCLFSLARTQVRPVDGFLHAIAQKTWNHARMCLLGGLNDVPLNFGGKTPQKLKFWGREYRTFKPEWQKFQTLITWKLLIRSWRNFNREYEPRVCLRGWFHGSPNKSQMAAAAIFNFSKMSITPHWIKISASNYTGRCITAMRRWPRDQKSKPEVISRDVIKWTSEA